MGLFQGDPKSIPFLLTFIGICYRLSTRLQTAMKHLSVVATHWGEIHQMNEMLRTTDKEFVDLSGIPFKGFCRTLALKDLEFSYPGRNFRRFSHFS